MQGTDEDDADESVTPALEATVRVNHSPDTALLAPMRALARRFAPEPAADMLPLIVTELLANAYDVADHDVDLVMERHGDEIVVMVSDDGPGFPPDDGRDRPDPFATGGRGLPIVRSLADRFDVERCSGRTNAVAAIDLRPDVEPDR